MNGMGRTRSTRLRHLGLLGSLVAAGACGGDAATAGIQVTEADHAFVGVSVIPMTGEGLVLENQTVAVHDGVIVAVGADVSLPEGTETIDGTGRYLMPGLSEMHAHVPPQQDPPREVLEDIMFLYIANGVTTIRGMLGAPYQIELADELESGDMVGPSFYVAAPSLNGNSAPTGDSAATLVRAHHAAGYDLLKIHPGIALDVWDVMTATADEVGITYAGHVPADVGLLHALESSMTCVDHLDGYVELLGADLFARVGAGEDVDEAELASAVSDADIQALVDATLAAGTYQVPTMYLWENFFNGHDPEAMAQLPEMAYVSENQRQAWVNQSRNRGQVPEAFGQWVIETRNRVLAALNDGGVPILMGTDSPQMFNVPGFALHREIKIYEAAGMSRYDILESGTRNVGRYTSEVLGLDGSFGTVENGQRADLVLLDANPLDDLENLTARAGVMVRGHWVSGAEIEAGLQALAAKHGG